MPSLTPLHETYCKWDRSPPSQADVLEGLAQLVSTPLSHVVKNLLHSLEREMLMNIFGLSKKKSKALQNTSYVQKFYQFSFDSLYHYGRAFLAPSLRKIIDQFPNLHDKALTPKMIFLISAINGVIGDYLLKNQNPLALSSVLYDHYGALQQGDLSGRLVIFCHGLCMNHLDWSNPNNAGIGEKLLSQRDHNTMLYLHYNTGRRISANGRSLANVLEDLVKRNPRITSIDLIGHSMGGLVSRSALFYGKQNMHQWLHMAENIVCLGSPHHGAVLERIGFAVQEKVGKLPIVKLAGHIVNIRSNGILDLRYGSVRDDDWEHNTARIGGMDDNRKPAPIPSHVNAFMVAGTIEFENKNNQTLKIIGDYLVSVESAFGEHPNPRFQLKIPEAHKAVFYGLNHMEIQYHSSVAEQIAKWFYPPHDALAEQQIRQYLIKLKDMDQQVQS